MENPDILYHYCSATTLFAIIKNQSLRATSLAYLNDQREVVHGQEALVAWCDSALKTEQRALSIKALTEMKEVAQAYDIRNLFGICFSQAGDKLSQWRGYANQGRGYAIGFRKSAFERKCFRLADGHLKNVIYDIEQFRTALNGQWYRDIRPDYNMQFIRDQVDICISMLKDEGFNEEKEWRIVVARDTNDAPKVSDKYIPFGDRIEFFERNGVLVPFVDLKTLPDIRLPIVKIVIGPAVGNKENAKYSLELLLRQAGYAADEVKVMESGIPFLP